MRITLLIGTLVTAFLISSPAAIAATKAEEKCAFLKRMEAGKYSLCRLKTAGVALKKGEVPDYTKCDEKLAKKFARLDALCAGNPPGVESVEALITTSADLITDATAIEGGVPQWSELPPVISSTLRTSPSVSLGNFDPAHPSAQFVDFTGATRDIQITEIEVLEYWEPQATGFGTGVAPGPAVIYSALVDGQERKIGYLTSLIIAKDYLGSAYGIVSPTVLVWESGGGSDSPSSIRSSLSIDTRSGLATAEFEVAGMVCDPNTRAGVTEVSVPGSFEELNSAIIKLSENGHDCFGEYVEPVEGPQQSPVPPVDLFSFALLSAQPGLRGGQSIFEAAFSKGILDEFTALEAWPDDWTMPWLTGAWPDDWTMPWLTGNTPGVWAAAQGAAKNDCTTEQVLERQTYCETEQALDENGKCPGVKCNGWCCAVPCETRLIETIRTVYKNTGEPQ